MSYSSLELSKARASTEAMASIPSFSTVVSNPPLSGLPTLSFAFSRAFFLLRLPFASFLRPCILFHPDTVFPPLALFLPHTCFVHLHLHLLILNIASPTTPCQKSLLHKSLPLYLVLPLCRTEGTPSFGPLLQRSPTRGAAFASLFHSLLFEACLFLR